MLFTSCGILSAAFYCINVLLQAARQLADEDFMKFEITKSLIILIALV